MRFYRESTDLMKNFIVAAIIALTSTVAAADQATYERYVGKFYQFDFCIGIGDVLESDYLDEIIEVVGEDAAIEVKNIRAFETDIIFQVGEDTSMNKIWKKKFYDYIFESRGQTDGWSYATNFYKAAGIEATVNNFLAQCKN